MNSEPRACCSELADEVGLCRSASDDCIGTLLQSFGHQIFKLSALIASHCEAGEVISLDPDIESELI